MDLSAEIAKLAEGTEAHLVSDTSFGVMHDRIKVPTPIPQLNCILGGGIPMGIIIEAFGDPASGKSSTWYQTMGNFQKTYPEGLSIIVDTEASVDSQRMPFMGIDSSKVLRIPATSVESGFDQVFKILDKKLKNPETAKLPVFIIWDTISVGATEKQLEDSGVYSGGMAERARVIKTMLQMLAPRIEKQPIIVVLLNQVSTQMGTYRPSLTSTGGWAIKHNAHLRLQYKGGKEDKDGMFAIRKHSTIDMVKSKISPCFNDLGIVLDNTKGGVIDKEMSMVDFAIDQMGLLELAGAWVTTNRLMEYHPEYYGYFDGGFYGDVKKRRNEIYEYAREVPAYLDLLELCFCEDIAERFEYQAEICKPYIMELRDRINNYFNIETEVVQKDYEIDVIPESNGDEVIGVKEEDTVKVKNRKKS